MLQCDDERLQAFSVVRLMGAEYTVKGILVSNQIYVTFEQLVDDCACELFCMLFQGI